MKLAFWRREPVQPESTGRTSRARGSESDRDEEARQLRVRARRRLVGAAALLMAAVILVPMVLDPAPRPVADSIPIEIPSEKTPFNPRLPLPPDPTQAQAAPPPDAAPPGDERKAEAAPAPAEDKAPAMGEASADKGSEKPAPKSPPAAAKAPATGGDDGARAREILEGKPARHLLQVAALANEKAADDLAAKLKKDGFPAYTERTQAGGGTRWRVRVGPFATRGEADKIRSRLREAGVGAQLVP